MSSKESRWSKHQTMKKSFKAQGHGQGDLDRLRKTRVTKGMSGHYVQVVALVTLEGVPRCRRFALPFTCNVPHRSVSSFKSCDCRSFLATVTMRIMLPPMLTTQGSGSLGNNHNHFGEMEVECIFVDLLRAS